MLQRFMAIKHPVTANVFNINKVNPWAVVDCWHLIGSQYTKVPGWIYTKTKATKKESTKKEFVPEDSTVDYYLQKTEMSIRDYKDALKFNKELLLNELKMLEKQMNTYGK